MSTTRRVISPLQRYLSYTVQGRPSSSLVPFGVRIGPPSSKIRQNFINDGFTDAIAVTSTATVSFKQSRYTAAQLQPVYASASNIDR